MDPRREARRRAALILYQADVTGRPPAELDRTIGDAAEDWTVERMAAVDRALLRLATYEILHRDVPAAVAIDEAVRAAKELSTEDSGRFVNGVLGRIARGAQQAE